MFSRIDFWRSALTVAIYYIIYSYSILCACTLCVCCEKERGLGMASVHCPLNGDYRRAGNFRGRKRSRISRFESHPRKFSPRNLGGRTTTTCDLFQAIRESFDHEILTSYGSAKVFSLESFPLYGICSHTYYFNQVVIVSLNFPIDFM